MSPRFPLTGPQLVLDASTKTIAVGILEGSSWRSLATGAGDALESIFRLARIALAQADCALPDLTGVLFCRGPGSLLGLRLAAMAVETWRTLPAHAHWSLHLYDSLAVTAARHLRQGETRFCVASSFRRDTFNLLKAENGTIGALDLCERSEIAFLEGPIFYVPNGSLRASPPDLATIEPHRIDDLPDSLAAFPDLLQPASEAEVLVPVAPEFARWTADRHRKPID